MCSRITRVRFVGKFMEIIRFRLHHLNVVEKLYLEPRLAIFSWLDAVEFDLLDFERNTEGKKYLVICDLNFPNGGNFLFNECLTMS